MCITRPSSMIIPIRVYVTVNLEKHGNTRGQLDGLDENLQAINIIIMKKMVMITMMHGTKQIFSFLMAFRPGVLFAPMVWGYGSRKNDGIRTTNVDEMQNQMTYNVALTMRLPF
ncbi:hypothetical protein BDA99DRAFT_537628 [Phascolomyces articulosus]|uniref:Uncharacterized protein n=1 Tax=Phascolomyces articulosus TaxID=60185 RepID=A0AAD5KA40_9FUNG|nr:hypothetical protein BDA99DRAFT_537628 [Phascolomyces articulosus]